MLGIDIILGNACSLLAMLADSYSSTRKTTKGVLWVQNVSQVLYGASTIFLKGYSASVQNAVSLLRNLVAIKKINSKILEWFLVILGVVLGIVFNNLGWIGYLPILANLQYTLAIFKYKDNERAIKISFAICVVLFIIFNFLIQNYVGFCSNIVILITTLVAVFRKKNVEEVIDDSEEIESK